MPASVLAFDKHKHIFSQIPVGHRELLERLVDSGLLTFEKTQVILTEHQQTGVPLDTLLLELGFVTPNMLTSLMAELKGVQRISLQNMVFDTELVRLIPRQIAEQFLVIPVARQKESLLIAMADPDDVTAYDQVRHYLPASVALKLLVASRAEILEAIALYYGFEMSLEGLLKEIDSLQADALRPEEHGWENPTIRFINALILDAVKKEASDIHLEPEGIFVRVRYRLDGLLSSTCFFHKGYWTAFSVRLKVISGMDIAESRKPQNGRFSFSVMGREVDFRVSSHPTVHGENFVIRILDKSHSLIPLDELGYSQTVIQGLKLCLERPEGLFLITGPTGSGKTTALYSILMLISSENVNIMTLEEPVEYRLPLIRQTEIREKMGLSFAEGIRSILRQDPDMILIGEIRDPEAAQMALRAAMTGHQVFSTLHSHDSLGALYRLMDLGISPAFCAGHLTGIMAQRLVRLLCVACKRSYEPTAREKKLLGISEGKLYRAQGCPQCQGRGYRQRTAVAEILVFDETIDSLLLDKVPRQAIKAHATRKGFKTLAQEGVALVLKGLTSLDEVRRVVGLPQVLLEAVS
jgi:type II secretory ATPase GspE/PulE/Tfp pilus assembly ATPase PilB-like protein